MSHGWAGLGRSAATHPVVPGTRARLPVVAVLALDHANGVLGRRALPHAREDLVALGRGRKLDVGSRAVVVRVEIHRVGACGGAVAGVGDLRMRAVYRRRLGLGDCGSGQRWGESHSDEGHDDDGADATTCSRMWPPLRSNAGAMAPTSRSTTRLGLRAASAADRPQRSRTGRSGCRAKARSVTRPSSRMSCRTAG